MSESLTIDLLYRTVVGRILLGKLVSPAVSERGARVLNSGLSARIVPSFVKKNGIDLEDYEVPEEGFASFNDFFTRKIKPGKRPIADAELICPSDGLLTVCRIDENSIFHIKHTNYSVKSLLGNEQLAKEFMGGTALIFRLTPAHYHRYSFCASGIVRTRKRIPGVLHSVKPVCHEKFPVFVQNSREYTVLQNENLGDIVQMEVGALLVGKISNHPCEQGEEVYSGQEKGYFEYGGSSIVVLTRAKLNGKRLMQGREKIHGEIPVKLGEALIDR